MSTPAILTRSRCELSRWMSSMSSSSSSSYESTSSTPTTTSTVATTRSTTSSYDFYYDYLDYEMDTGPNGDVMAMMDPPPPPSLQHGGDSMDDYFYYCWEQSPCASNYTCPQSSYGGNNRALSSSPALHELVALHATCGQDVAHFFQTQTPPAALSLQQHHHQIPPTSGTATPPSTLPTSSSAGALPSLPCGATALHVALLRNSYHVDSVVAALLQQQGQQLAATPMRHCQSLPLHIYLAHAVTIQGHLVQRLLAAYPAAAQWIDAAGDTPLSLLWRNVMRFRWAQEWECHEQVPVCMGASDEKNAVSVTTTSTSSSGSSGEDATMSGDTSSWMTLIPPEEFLACALPLVRASSAATTSLLPGLLTWHEVCQTTCCPPLLLRMLLWHEQQPFPKHGVHFINPGSGLLEADTATGRLPLHWAAAALPCQPYGPYKYQSVVELVLQAEPTAAGIPDCDGQLPLHILLNKYINNATLSRSNINNGFKSYNHSTVLWPAIRALIRAYPQALSWPDPTTGLCPALQLAAVTNLQHQQQCLNDNKDDEALDLLYGVLRDDPSCLPAAAKKATPTGSLDHNDAIWWGKRNQEGHKQRMK